jgi:hypothetical protein
MARRRPKSSQRGKRQRQRDRRRRASEHEAETQWQWGDAPIDQLAEIGGVYRMSWEKLREKVRGYCEVESKR